uniref:C2H2-type domain-containing protein n=1 Tax=Astyanax mexicanus TaxID=7994 RepID=A0A3B1J3N0_ASTMX
GRVTWNSFLIQEEKEEGGCDVQVNCNSLDEPDEPMDSDPLDKGDEPMDSDSLEKDHCPSHTKSEDGPREMQGTAETICSAPVDATSVLNHSTSTENSEDPNHNTSEMETQRAVEQPEPVTEKTAPSEDVLDETSKSMSPGHVPELDQKPLTASECNSEASELNSLDQKADPRKYLCPRCGRLFRHVGRLRAHMLTHSRGKSFTCGECGRISEDWSTYMEHLQEHPDMPHICDICGKGFQSPVVLKRHRVGHCFQDRETDTPHIVDVQPTVKPYECGKCSASFKTLDRLFSHQLCHSTKRDSNLSLSNGIINGHKELKEEKQQNSAQKDHKSNQHVRASTSESNTSDSCQDTANGSSPSSLPMVPNGSDEAKAQPQQDIDTSVSQSTATLPLSSSDSESIPPEVEEEVKTPTFTYERTKEIKKNAEPDQTIGDATPRSKPERKTGLNFLMNRPLEFLQNYLKLTVFTLNFLENLDFFFLFPVKLLF